MVDERRRPGGRTARVTAAVRAATVGALTEHGWNGLTVEDVAARAGVNKTTIYRRWGDREALVADVLLTASDQQIPLPDTGSLRGDLVAFARQVRDAIAAPANRALLSTLAAGRRAPLLGPRTVRVRSEAGKYGRCGRGLVWVGWVIPGVS